MALVVMAGFPKGEDQARRLWRPIWGARGRVELLSRHLSKRAACRQGARIAIVVVAVRSNCRKTGCQIAPPQVSVRQEGLASDDGSGPGFQGVPPTA